MLDEIVKMTELDLHTVDAIAVAGGPGSFTGLRIGSATAKGLGLALEKPLIHIPTLEGLACNLCGIADVVCPIMEQDAGRCMQESMNLTDRSFTYWKTRWQFR